MKRELEIAVDNMKRLAATGVILPGGDYGSPGPIGTDARDLEHFVNLLRLHAAPGHSRATEFGGQIMLMGGELGR